MRKVDIIGGGLSGLYAACYLAKQGVKVRVFEKNESLGGRSRAYKEQGFTFDMGPSWYWMPELVDKLFSDLGEDRKNYFQLTQLKPSYRIFWKDDQPTDMPADMKGLEVLFDQMEKDGSTKLKKFLKDAKVKYDIATADFMENPGVKWSELLNLKALKNAVKLDVFKSVEKDVAKRFSSDKARAILNFPVLFLGEMPSRIPSLYTLMNYVDLELGTWYPDGGMNALAAALVKIAQKEGVEVYTNSEIKKFNVKAGKIESIEIGNDTIPTEEIIASADYHFVEQNLVPKEFRRYDSKYWNTRKLAPSCLIYYVGVSKKVSGLLHHNLFFDEDLNAHGKEIYENPKWPEKPLFYVCAPSTTDKTVAPDGFENLFFLMPIATEIEDTEEIREKYFQLMLNRVEKHTGTSFTDSIIYKRSYAINDFAKDYNAYKGNAYGLANTLRQTANLKPKITSKLKNLHYCGQLTVPGPGIPPALISGKVVAKQILKNYEKTI
jgi:phytoene desaturase